MKKGFTIVELLMVITIIAVLMGIVTTAASESIKQSRSRKADALCSLVQAGLNAYYAQNDKWPGPLGSKIESGSLGTRPNQEGPGRQNDPDKFVLNGGEVKDMVLELVTEAKNGNPLMDISGLFVSKYDGELSGGDGTGKPKKAYGLDFMSAIHGTKQSPKKMTTGQMFFGYPDPETGYFLRFKIVYSISTDQFNVTKQR